MANNPIDLTNVREITGGDAATERELFGAFIESSDECIAGLKNSLNDDKSGEWRAHAHALKGSSLNLGAMHLGLLCKQAQDGNQAPRAKKEEMLTAIEGEYGRVKDYLKSSSATPS